MRTIFCIIALAALCGCQTLTDIANALPPETPQEQCTVRSGKWLDVTVYDAAGHQTVSGECVIPGIGAQ